MHNPLSSTTVTTNKLLGDEYVKVSALYDNLASITTIANDISSINSVYASLGNINLIAPCTEEIKITADNKNSIIATANNINKIVTVSDNISSVTSVSENMDSIASVSADLSSINSVASSLDDLTKVVAKDVRFTPNNEISIIFEDGHSLSSEPLRFNSEDKSTIIASQNKVPISQTIGVSPIAEGDSFGVSYFCNQDIEEFKDNSGVVNLSDNPLTVEKDLGAYLFYHENELSQFLAIKHTKDGISVPPENWSVSDTVTPSPIPKGSLVTGINYLNITRETDLSPFYKLTIYYTDPQNNSVSAEFRSINPLTTATDLSEYVERVGVDAKAASLPIKDGGLIKGANPQVIVHTESNTFGKAIIAVGQKNNKQGYMSYDAALDVLEIGTEDSAQIETRAPVLTAGYNKPVVDFVRDVTIKGVEAATKEDLAPYVLEDTIKQYIEKEINSAVSAALKKAMPIGTIITRAVWEAPDDTWRICNGDKLDPLEYPEYVELMGERVPNFILDYEDLHDEESFIFIAAKNESYANKIDTWQCLKPDEDTPMNKRNRGFYYKVVYFIKVKY